MFRNLIALIFIIALALPAVAMPAPSAPETATMSADCHGMPMEKPDDKTGEHEKSLRLHGCIGCIAPVSPVFNIVPSAALPFITQSSPYRELSGTIAGPTIPPPRS